MKQITVEMLRAKRVAAGQVAEFKRRFPNGVTFANEADAIAKCLAGANALNWDCFAEHLLPAEALVVYREVTAPAWAAYREAMAEARAPYDKAAAAAWAAFREATDEARAAYHEALPEAFARAFMAGDNLMEVRRDYEKGTTLHATEKGRDALEKGKERRLECRGGRDRQLPPRASG